jgi:phospholipase A1/A2
MRRIILLLLLSSFVQCASAQVSPCKQISEEQERLNCYDQWVDSRPATASDDRTEVVAQVENESLLKERWELDSDPGEFIFRPYKPVYFFPVFYSSNVNTRPQTPTRTLPTDDELSIDSVENKFQLSFKTKLAKDLLGHDGDLWLGYTQSSHWQLYNSKASRPFRETNHEPELIFTWRTKYELSGYSGQMMSLSLNHQSNGRSEPLSRSWNRLILTIGLDRPDWVVMLRPWWRVPEASSDDDNPDIENYMGRAELLIVHRKRNSHQISGLIRHSLRDGNESRGSINLDWSYPCFDRLRCHAQIFSGYGESMIDYNHRTTTLGLGISLLEWF